MEKYNKLSCLIIEDEPIAAEVLEDYVNQISFLELKGICRDAIFALEKLRSESIDVIFLDIHLPKLKGLDFLKILNSKPQTILTTAYHEYAIDAFEADVVDYLMKPIEFTRFLKAVNKLKQKKEPSTTISDVVLSEPRPFRFFNVNKKMIKIYIDDIIYIESLKDYSKIITTDDSFITRGQLGEMEEKFKSFNFIRIHRSYVVSLDKVRAYSASAIDLPDKTLPIGRSYKESVSKELNMYF